MVVPVDITLGAACCVITPAFGKIKYLSRIPTVLPNNSTLCSSSVQLSAVKLLLSTITIIYLLYYYYYYYYYYYLSYYYKITGYCYVSSAILLDERVFGGIRDIGNWEKLENDSELEKERWEVETFTDRECSFLTRHFHACWMRLDCCSKFLVWEKILFF